MLKHYLSLSLKVFARRKFFTFVSLFGISFTLIVLMLVSALFDHAVAPFPPDAEIPVVERGRLVGMLTARDVAAAHPSAATTLTVGEIHAWRDRSPVARIMGRGVSAAVGPDTPVDEVVHLMRARHLTSVPVVRGDRLVGVVTRQDVLALIEALLSQGGGE